LTARR